MGLPPTADTLPDALVDRDQWVCWRTQQRDDNKTKVPIIPETTQFASTTDPDTWRTFQTAREAVTTTPAEGLGFVFTTDDPLIGVDLDDCRDPDTGEPATWASQIITQLDSYTEVSPSGTGYHVLITGTLPDGRNRAGDLELYDRSRFFTVTGAHVDDTPTTVADRTEAVESVHTQEVASETASSNPTATTEQSASDDHVASDPPTASGPAALDDETLLDRARNAANGAKFSRLWGGDTSGYESHSEADMALCRLLAFWTGCDHNRIDRLFRRSGLARDKWDEVHYADGTTYGDKTVERAIARTDDVYTPPEATDSASTSAGESDSPAAGGGGTTWTATANTDPTLQASTTHADSSPPTPAASPSNADTTAESSSGTTTTATASQTPHPQDTTDQLARIDELTARVETLMKENEELRADLAAERTRRKELERELDTERASWWPL
ncbi:hypothetical protein [Halorubrum sp. AJ67]|uniref:phage NrS-1 polymerase family protein n=1 Tax=Halorubrum sp. AJ67 TaxID=1173487 RepID=UPI0003DD9F2B|nr:hypothetical protein [Halorubrum sp. AJ67]CDK39374.1 uncharacterized protein BN903_148 [Halorubrum sp. AJ67]